MQEIILQKCDEWTTGLGPRESRINVFEQIRDIPFHITWASTYESSLSELLIQNKGSCASKHVFLGEMYQILKIPIKYTIYPFKWSDLAVDYSEKLRKLADKLPVDYHGALKAHINGKWILVDATWDLPLKSVGFPVNDWDGLSDTVNAVNPLGETVHETIQEIVDYVTSESRHTRGQNFMLHAFYVGLNTWLEDVRARSC